MTMALHITRHTSPTEEKTSETEKTSQENKTAETPMHQISPASPLKYPTLPIDPSIPPPSLKPIERQMVLMAEHMVETSLEKALPKIISTLTQEAQKLQEETLTSTKNAIALAQKKFAVSIEEMVEQDLIPKMTPSEIQAIANLLGETSESQTRKERALQSLNLLKDSLELENQKEQLREFAWENSRYSLQEAIASLCELINKYIPVDTESAKQSSLQESKTMLLNGRIENMGKVKKTSNTEEYLKNTPVYRAVLLFRATKIECDSRALCSTCPFRLKGEECKLWKQAFALQDIAFYRAQSVSQAQYQDTVSQKLVEAQIEIAALRQQITEEQTKAIDLQGKLDKLASGSKRLTSANKNTKQGEDYETELDPYLRFR